MNKPIMLITVLVLVGAGAAFFVLRAPTDPQGEDKSADTGREDARVSGSGSLKSLLALGQDLICDVAYQDPQSDNRTEGTTYLAGERVRGDFTIEQQGAVYRMSTIHDGSYVYTWGQGPSGEMAMKFAIDERSQATVDESNDLFESDDAVEYACAPWVVDPGRFVPPSDIEFQDMSDILGQMRTDAGDLESVQCAACDQAPAEARAQCRTALQCE